MGNLGRAGFGATLEGTVSRFHTDDSYLTFLKWPYTYDACDVGTAPNQTVDGLPEVALTTGGDDVNGELSYLPGQRLSRCTCPGESHPGPKHSDGSFVGRAAPEIDVFEAQVSNSLGEVSQSGQWAVSASFSIHKSPRVSCVPCSLSTRPTFGTTAPRILSSPTPRFPNSTRILVEVHNRRPP